jgi:hypothetical protein
MAVAVPLVATLSASVRAEAGTLPPEETVEPSLEETRALDNQAAIRGPDRRAPRVALSNVHASDTTY